MSIMYCDGKDRLMFFHVESLCQLLYIHYVNLCYFRAVGIGAILTTAFACIFIFAQIVMDGLDLTKSVKHDTHGFTSFFLAFGTILFSFGGASTFPTIQNDMINKRKFSTSVVIGFSGKCWLMILKLNFEYLNLSLCKIFDYWCNCN